MRDVMPPSAVFLKDRPAVEDDALETVTAFFGISEDRDENGSARWTIKIEPEQTGDPIQRASYDKDASCWKLTKAFSSNDNEITAAEPRVSDQGDGTTDSKESKDSGDSNDSKESKEANKPNEINDSNELDGPPAYSKRDKLAPEEYDWLSSLPQTKHVDLLRNVDWSNTPLGPVISWPAPLRLYVHMCLSDRRAACLYWGPDHVAIYNESFVPLIGDIHPHYLGSSFEKALPERWEKFRSIFHEIEETGTGCTLTNYPLFLNRNGYLEETYWIGDLFPLKEINGKVSGCYFTWQETTRQVIQDRRSKLIEDIGKPPVETEEEVYEHINRVFGNSPYDVPMGVTYSADHIYEDDTVKLRLRHAIGLETDERAAPKEIQLDSDTGGFGPALREARKSMQEWVLLDQEAASFPKEIIDGVDWMGYHEPSHYIVVIPLFVVNKLLKGFVILGLNPRRTLDADHRQYLSELSRRLQNLMTRVTTTEQTKRREAQLMRKLTESENRIRRMAEMAPFGMFDQSVEGHMIWANETFFEITGCKSKNLDDYRFEDVVYGEDHDNVNQKLQAAIRGGAQHISDTIRLKRTWKPPTSPSTGKQPEEEHAWVLYQAYPNSEDGKVTSLHGSITDISSLKWAEKVQARSAETAQRAKERQEEFIDITSHEIRNPLSAITQCADGIYSSLQEAEAAGNNANILLDIVKENAAAAESILLCSSHQKRIIDDVLTLSKLDSAILNITPAVFRPDSLVIEARQMFLADFSSNDIELDVVHDLSPFSPEDPVYCDSSRLMQILVNLLTNAIKFTRTEKTRKITIRTGIRGEPPPTSLFGEGFNWHPSDVSRKDLTVEADYGEGGPVFLYFAVDDSGQGISAKEADRLFDKWAQASRRTHIKYGGSGLGLFISRELTEMQGGLIGLSSKEGKGSMFAFYIKAKRAVLPSKSPEDKAKKKRAGSTGSISSHMPPPKMAVPLATRSKPEEDTREVSTQTSAQTSAHTTRPSTPYKSDYHVLLVEDNQLNQKVLAKQLRKVGCTVAVANHGGEAIDYLLRMHEQPAEWGTPETEPLLASLDCVLMDWEMPVCDGLQATKRIRELEEDGDFETKHLILGVTANARQEQIEIAKEAGMDDVLPKPFKIPELIRKMEALLPDPGQAAPT